MFEEDSMSRLEIKCWVLMMRFIVLMLLNVRETTGTGLLIHDAERLRIDELQPELESH